MRTLMIVGVLAACGAPSPPPEKPERQHRGPPCLPYTEHSVRARTDGAAVLIEQLASPSSCGDGGEQTVTPLARIALTPAAAGCPIGQLAVRMWDGGHGSDNKLAAFVAALDKLHHAELRQQLMYFADGTDAYVIECHGPGRADFLLVEWRPQNGRAKIALFVGDKLVDPTGTHPRVTFAAPAY